MSTHQPDRPHRSDGFTAPGPSTQAAPAPGFVDGSRVGDLIISGCGLAGIAAAVGVFMPWAGATLSDRGADLLPVSRTGLELSWNGAAVLGLGILCVVVSVLLREVPRARPLSFALPPAGLAIVVLAAVKINSGDAMAARLLRLRIGTFQTDHPVAGGNVGLGLWLSLVAGVVLVLGGIGCQLAARFPRASGDTAPSGDVPSSDDVAR
ncbi:hypothetical protein [Frankia sp. Cppng1_Ct_nod]|uniref:hypothetical protein n=1 Tax=Frankia sp. Cppng1_Ct_nod TaxID=2897162 RepID=UPI0010411595|nr:hypothetical protein [Frankia sp. Cppng1_Ct_nod]